MTSHPTHNHRASPWSIPTASREIGRPDPQSPHAHVMFVLDHKASEERVVYRTSMIRQLWRDVATRSKVRDSRVTQ